MGSLNCCELRLWTSGRLGNPVAEEEKRPGWIERWSACGRPGPLLPKTPMSSRNRGLPLRSIGPRDAARLVCDCSLLAHLNLRHRCPIRKVVQYHQIRIAQEQTSIMCTDALIVLALLPPRPRSPAYSASVHRKSSVGTVSGPAQKASGSVQHVQRKFAHLRPPK